MSAEVVQPPGGGRVLEVGDDRVSVKLEQSGPGTISVVEYALAPGSGPGQHTHDRCDETYYVLEGALTVRLGRDQQVLSAGSLLHVPAGVVHGFRNETDEPVRILWVFTPGDCLTQMAWSQA